MNQDTDNLKELKFLKDKLFISGTCITDTVCNNSDRISLNEMAFKPEVPTELLPVFKINLKEEILNTNNTYYNIKENEEEYNHISDEIYNKPPHFNFFVQIYDSTNNFMIRDRYLIEKYLTIGKKFFNYENFYILDLETMVKNNEYMELIMKFFLQYPSELKYAFFDRIHEPPFNQVQLMPGYNLLVKYLKEGEYTFSDNTTIETLEKDSNEPEFIKHLVDNYKFFVDIYSIYKNSINNDIYAPTSNHKLAFTVLSVYHYVF